MAEAPRLRHVSAIDQFPDDLGAPAPAVDVGDRAQTEKRIKEVKQDIATEAETLKWIMSEDKGRRFIFSFLANFRAYSNPMSFSDPYTTAFNCGEKNAALWILTRVESADPSLYLQMLEENK